ncbi:MAG: beta-lactamase family protein [Asgard group archaeon]|nr:beta-lactamase family protein [Asgard group archaeon]
MPTITKEIINELRAEIKNEISTNNVTGLAISLLDEKDILWLETFGFRNLETKSKVTPNTIFSIQSIGKVFTTLGFMLAVNNSLISLDDKLLDYYPDFTVNSRYGNPEVDKITFRHLLSHYAGFTHRTKVGGEYDLSEPIFLEYIKSISDTWLRYPVGDRFLYSNLGMSLVAYCLEKISGLSFPEYIQKEICKPLGIDSLVYGKKASLRNPNRAEGYYLGRKAEYSNIIFYGAGGQFLSVKDMSRFVQFMINEGSINGKQYIKSELFTEMANEQFNKSNSKKFYGLGLEIDKETFSGLEIRNHSGGGYGYNAYIAWNVQFKVGIVVLTNVYPSQIAKKIGDKALMLLLKYKGAEILVPKVITPTTFITKPRIDVDSKVLEKLEGLYTISGGKFEFKITNNKPLAVYSGKSIPLYSHSEIEFTADIPIAMKFLVNNEKPIAVDVLTPEGIVHRFNYQGKIEEEVFGPNKENWKKFEGLYYTTYLGDPLYLAVKLENGHLKIFMNNKGEILKEYKENIFFTNDERAVIFQDGLFYYDNIKLNLLDQPIKMINEIYQKNSIHRFLSVAKLKEIYFNLKYLGRNKEMERIEEIFGSLYPNEK